MNETNAQVFRKGMKDAIPIGLGYLAVAFSLGIAARNAGMNAFQGFLMSMLNNASAGEYAGITVIAANSPYCLLYTSITPTTLPTRKISTTTPKVEVKEARAP